jgi:N-acetylmuramoyl-L-alanine amidase
MEGKVTMSKLFVAAGHAMPNVDPGAVSPFGKESAIAIAVVDQAVALCAGQNKNGREIVKVPHEYNLDRTISFINSNSVDTGHDLAIEVHLNSNAGTAGTGTETYYGLPDLANEVNEEVVKVLGLRNRGVKDGNMFWFNNGIACGTCLVELGFVNNGTDVDAIIARGGLALAKAMIRACGGTFVDKTPPPVVKPPVVVENPPVVTPPAPIVTPPTPVVIPEEKLNVGLLNRLLQRILDFIKKLMGGN